MISYYLIILFIFLVLSVAVTLSYIYNKKLFAQLVLLLMKLIEKMILSSGQAKFELVADIAISTLKTIQKVIPIPVNENKIKATIQSIYDNHKDEINRVVSIYAKKSEKKILKDLEKELCDNEKKDD